MKDEVWERYDTWLVDKYGIRNISPTPWASDGLDYRLVEMFPICELELVDLRQHKTAPRSNDKLTD